MVNKVYSTKSELALDGNNIAQPRTLHELVVNRVYSTIPELVKMVNRVYSTSSELALDSNNFAT